MLSDQSIKILMNLSLFTVAALIVSKGTHKLSNGIIIGASHDLTLTTDTSSLDSTELELKTATSMEEPRSLEEKKGFLSNHEINIHTCHMSKVVVPLSDRFVIKNNIVVNF